jgi:hypothetical protein
MRSLRVCAETLFAIPDKTQIDLEDLQITAIDSIEGFPNQTGNLERTASRIRRAGRTPIYRRLAHCATR